MGIGLHEFFARRRPWSQLDKILTRLPQESHYKAALAADDELAERASTDKSRPEIPLVGYGQLAIKLDNIYDALMLIRTEQINTTPGIKQPAKFKPVERPRTAQDRRAERMRDMKLSSLEKRLMGNRDG